MNGKRLALPRSLCTDVPTPSGKIGRGFFLREGGRLYTGYLPRCNKEIDQEKCITKVQHNLSQKSNQLKIRRTGTGKQLFIEFQEISFKH